MREKLVSLIQDSVGGCARNWAEVIADSLLAHGVIVVDTAAVSVANRPLISQCLGRPLDEIIELVQAKNDGRVIVLPCKVGDMVYTVNRRALGGHWDDNRYIVDDWSELKVCEIPFSMTLWECGWEGVYLTREEAEKELERRKSDD